MKNLLSKAVLCSDWIKIGVGVSLIVFGLFLPGCGTVKGFGKAIGHVCQGIGDIGEGLENDCTAASDGHSDQYYQNRRN